jgi:hypothetical protein
VVAVVVVHLDLLHNLAKQAVQVLSFFAIPAQSNISLVAQ